MLHIRKGKGRYWGQKNQEKEDEKIDVLFKTVIHLIYFVLMYLTKRS